MDMQFMNIEEIEMITDGCAWYGAEFQGSVIIEGICCAGGKVADGARWIWNGIRNIF